MNDSATEIDIVLDYHQRTKHQLNRYAQALGYMDWENQPNPFRSYHGTSKIALVYGEDSTGPLYRALFSGEIPPEKVSYASISRLFYYSMALSAWKQVPGGASWPLRVNPSSGNLHPTESYLIMGSQTVPEIQTGLYHYRPDDHSLEKRRSLDSKTSCMIEKQLPLDGFIMGLSSIYWRETWKYGERGFRYCHHDVGHAIGAISVAALSLGWRTTLVDTMTDEAVSLLLGCENPQGVEAEHADCLIIIDPNLQHSEPEIKPFHLNQTSLKAIKNLPCLGKANPLSQHHHDWPIIEKVSSASRKKEDKPDDREKVNSTPFSHGQKTGADLFFPKSKKTAFKIIRQRRSAVAMDGSSELDRSAFYGMLQRLQPGNNSSPFASLPWAPKISLFLFVHRVLSLDSGLYVLVRSAHHFDLLKASIKQDFLWEKPEACPSSLNLYLLAPQDVKQISKSVSCTQDIAADGFFSLGMLAYFETVVREKGAHFYPRLFWEAGLIGQLLYLEAEAAEVQGTGIGCFFDDLMHEHLGIQDRSWQSLYHFTVGRPIVDNRLQTLSGYQHCRSE